MFHKFLPLPVIVATCALFLSCENRKSTPDWASQEDSSDLQNKTDVVHESITSKASEDTPSPEATDSSATSTLMYYNIRNYLTMRRGDKEKAKPEEEIKALITHIIAVNPDILCICEIGDQDDLNDLQLRLKKAGLDLPNTYLAMGSDPTRRQAILTTYPLQSHEVPRRTYRLNKEEHEIRRGILDATVETPQGSFRFLGAHLKSKRPSKEFDHNLVRRNEALLLRKHISSILEKNTAKLIVYGDFNDTRNSPSVRTIRGPYSGKTSITPIDLRAKNGSRWTHHWSYQDIYSKIDYVMFSQAMKPHILLKGSRVFDIPRDDPASDHRPLVVLLK